MKIICPVCAFEREMDKAALPPTAAVATCPRCKERFRFRSLSSSAPAPQHEDPGVGDEPDDDALPPGAVVPPRKRDLEDEELFAHPRDTSRGEREAAARERDGDESRRQAAEAYRRTAEQLSSQDDEDETDNPWENPIDGYPAAFYQTTVRVLFAAPRFFSGLRPRRRVLRPLIFYLLVGLVQILSERFWLVVFTDFLDSGAGGSGLRLGNLFELLSTEASLPLFILARVAFISLELFLAVILYRIMFRLVASDKADLSLIFQVLAYASAPAVFGVVPLLGSFVGFFWSIACVVIGCRYALRITWAQTVLAIGPLYLVAFLVLTRVLGSASV